MKNKEGVSQISSLLFLCSPNSSNLAWYWGWEAPKLKLNNFLPLLSTLCILQAVHVCFQTLQDTAGSLTKDRNWSNQQIILSIVRLCIKPMFTFKSPEKKVVKIEGGLWKSHCNILMHVLRHTQVRDLRVWNSRRINMPTLHPANRHLARAPCVTVVTGSSRGWKGQSSSSESARSTTTPGWRHWAGRL